MEILCVHCRKSIDSKRAMRICSRCLGSIHGLRDGCRKCPTRRTEPARPSFGDAKAS